MFFTFALPALLFATLCLGTPVSDPDYNFNTQNHPSTVDSSNVASLYVKYNITTCGSVTGKPVDIGSNISCVTDFGGCITCFNYETGTKVWQTFLTSYGFPIAYFARVGMAYKDGLLFAGTSSLKSLLLPGLPYVGSWAFAINATDGSLKWRTQVSQHLYAIITQDPLLDGDVLYYGVSSGEAAAPLIPAYTCCSFVGSTVAISAANGQILWQTPNIPPELSGVGKYSGAASWGGRPVVVGRYIYQPVGQLYQTPSSVAICNRANTSNPNCVNPSVMFDAVIKLNKETGQIVAHFRASPADTWNIACFLAGSVPGVGGLLPAGLPPGCQGLTIAHDYDITNIMYSCKTRQIIATSKSGFVWFLDLDLNVVGSHSVVAGDAAGGYVFRGAIKDDPNPAQLSVFLPNANSGSGNATLPDGTKTTRGLWIRYDGSRNVKWMTPCPTEDTAYGSVGITNDIVFGSTRQTGILVFMDQADGQILKTIQTKGSMVGTPYAVGNKIIWGTGPGNLLNPTNVDQNQVLVLAVA